MAEIIFKPGDIVKCIYKLRKRSGRTWIVKNNCRVRITSICDPTIPSYRVYNLTLNKYSIIEQYYLRVDIQYNRDIKIQNILDDNNYISYVVQ